MHYTPFVCLFVRPTRDVIREWKALESQVMSVIHWDLVKLRNEMLYNVRNLRISGGSPLVSASGTVHLLVSR